VLIPAYNAAAWLPDTIKSALNQTWPRLEIIIVDDGSTDETLKVARAFQGKNVKVVTQPNSGAPAARNAALAHCQGDYVQWLDADDLLHEDKIAAQMRVAEDAGDPRMLLAGAFGTFYYRTEGASFVRTSLWRTLSPLEYFLTRFNDNVYFQTDAWLVSRELTTLAGPWTDFHSPDDDGEYFCRVVRNSTNVTFVEGARSYYRVANYGGVSQGRSPEAQTALFESKAKCIGYLLSLEDSARTRAAAVRLLEDWLPSFYPGRPDLVERARHLARDLGGELHLPTLKWKYRPVGWLFGYDVAVQASAILPRIKAKTARKWDRLRYLASA
jgi:glycosyltransferase involved in cell wall biosynthesis